MAYEITHKNSTVAGTPPAASEIEIGEIAINAADAELYTKDTGGNVQTFISQFTQDGTGAVARTVASKLKDVVSVKDFGAVGDGITDDTAAIQAAIDAMGSRGGGEVHAPAGVYAISSTIKIGNGSSGTASTYQNVELVGGGSSPLASASSATQFKWIGATSTAAVMVEIAGRMTGGGVSNIYINADSKAGTCLQIKSNVLGRFDQVYAHNFTRAGIELTVQENAPTISWYTTTNTFNRCFVTSTQEGAQAYRLAGRVDNGIRNDPHRNVFTGCIGSVPRTLDTSKPWPAALYLGYTDSNTFIECDLQLNSITENSIVDDREQLNLVNGAGYTNGHNVKVRYFDNPIGGPDANVRHEYYYQYAASSIAADDGVNVLAPADGIGRFLRYQGSCVAVDATVQDKYPLNNFLYGCALIKNPSLEDITDASSGNSIGFSLGQGPVLLLNHTTADAENIPAKAYINGVTDTNVHFGSTSIDSRGDVKPIVLSQTNNLRRLSVYLNAASNNATHYGGVLRFEERVNDWTDWTETGRFSIAKDGAPILRKITQAPALQQPGRLVWADGTTYDPLSINTPGARKSYLSFYDGTNAVPIVPGNYVLTFELAADDFTSLPFPGGLNTGLITAICHNTSAAYGQAFMYCGVAGSVSPVADPVKEGSLLNFTTGAMTASTGEASKVNVSVHTDNSIYVNNRTAIIRKITLHVHAALNFD